MCCALIIITVILLVMIQIIYNNYLQKKNMTAHTCTVLGIHSFEDLPCKNVLYVYVVYETNLVLNMYIASKDTDC